jgi:hypothetical protein
MPSDTPGPHLEATMEWLSRAQDTGSDRGVATTYSLRNGWMASYPETTGYIVPTFFDYAVATDQAAYRERALEMGEWLLGIQLPDGAFQAGPVDRPPEASVFNTGQILLGLVRLLRETGDDRYLAALARAADWLVDVQDEDGAWRRFAYNGMPHAYYTRVAWALLEAASVAGSSSHAARARQQLDWALDNQVETGWFQTNSFDGVSAPFTHTIVYAAEGLLGAGLILDDARYLGGAKKVADGLVPVIRPDGFLAGQLDARWSSEVRYACLTGSAQLAGLLLELHRRSPEPRYAEAAIALNRFVGSTQSLASSNPGIRGGVKGSHPVWGGYMTYSYPNWAAKFFADALLAEERLSG